MTVTIYAELTTGDVDFSLTLVEMSGGIAVGGGPVASTTQRVCHETTTSVLGFAVDSIGSWLRDALNAATTMARTYTVTWNAVTHRYTIDGSGTFQILFTNAATRTLLGFASNTSATQATYTGTLQPTYMIIAAMTGRSFVSDDYEQGVVAAQAESDDGEGYGVQVGTAAKFSDFSLVHEPKSKVFTRSALAAAPWTYQDLWEHCRVGRAFVVEDTLTGESTVHRFTAEGAAFSGASRQRFMGEDFDDSWRLNFKTRLVGRL